MTTLSRHLLKVSFSSLISSSFGTACLAHREKDWRRGSTKGCLNTPFEDICLKSGFAEPVNPASLLEARYKPVQGSHSQPAPLRIEASVKKGGRVFHSGMALT